MMHFNKTYLLETLLPMATFNLFISAYLLPDEIKPIFDRCTNDILSRPDWESNIQFVDAVNSINTTEL
jgi:hypothetical protein